MALPTGFADDHHYDVVPIDQETVDCLQATQSTECYVEAPPITDATDWEFEPYYIPWLSEEVEVPLSLALPGIGGLLGTGQPGGTGNTGATPPPPCEGALHTHGLKNGGTSYSVAQVHVHHNSGCDGSATHTVATTGNNGRAYHLGHDHWEVYYYDLRNHISCFAVLMNDGETWTEWECWGQYN